MRRITIVGPNKFFPRKELRAYLEWVSERLLGEDANKINLRVVFKNKLSATNLEDPTGKGKILEAKCYAIWPGSDFTGLPRTIIIHMVGNKFIIPRQKRILAHELVHGKQFARHEIGSDMLVWKKRILKKALPYEERPWEIEANKLSRSLVRRYNRLCQKKPEQ